MFIATNARLTKEITECGTSDVKLHATITDVQESGNSMCKRKEQTMSKWICVDDVIVEIGGGYIDIDAESFMNAPSIDIVRCKECKYKPICSHSVQHTTHEPTSVTIGYRSVDFCSYGEREGE